MSLSISKNVGTQYDSSGNLITASYWKIISIAANTIAQTFTISYGGYDGVASFNANPTQPPLATVQINYPDPVNAPSAAWPFAPATLVANFPGNPMAFLAAAEAYAMLNPFFSGATQVS
jgi:hypothetical protein